MSDTTITPAVQPSILTQLYAMRDNPAAEAGQPVEVPKTVTPETTITPVVEQKPEVVQGATETKPETVETDPHETLPPAAQKRLDKLILETVSERKALKAERETLARKLAEATTGKQGTEPVKPEPVAANAKPIMPDAPEFGESGHESETWEQYGKRQVEHKAAVKKYHTDIDAWHSKTTREQVEQEFSSRQARDAHEAVVKQAIKEHGEDFLALTEVVASKAPLPMQHALLELEDWPTIAVYLARNTDRLDEVVEKFGKSPAAAIATLGRIQASLKARVPKQQATETELPAPLKPVGGGAAAIVSADLNKLAEKPGALLSELKRRRAAGAV